jgi:Ca-activated chloride channel family protein
MFRFAHDIALNALALVPLVLLLFWWNARWRKKAMDLMGDSAVLESMMPLYSPARRRWKRALQAIAIGFIVIGIANPQVGSKYEEVKRKGFELMICLDVSNSMLAEDLQPNRLERAKQAISTVIDRLKNDKIGIVVFAGEAYIQLPLTVDHSAAKLFLRSINTDMVATQGTAIGRAINLAVNSFSADAKSSKHVIVITDGEGHEDDPLSAAQEARNLGITVHGVGIGSVDGTPIPVYRQGQMTGFRKDREGSTVVTRLDEVTLQKMAAEGGGTYVRATTSRTGLTQLMDELEGAKREEYGSKMFTSYEDRFQYFLGVALFLLLLEFIMPSRKRRLFTDFNLFRK